ncbi:YdeI/OmpD-associated family protein [Segetibacter koreensis]|uniref:YdeI/OmpD-associated family protein n=1 Tax=Segetibacter koreensis TaxID=398037 RepID=UPI00036FB355|nr:YdeI/OmpD-associated family protein [Segetibacter koreensis]
MVEFTATIKKFGAQGEKTGWTYIEVSSSVATQLMPGNKKSFRVKGSFDQYVFEGISLIPMGGGDFIIPLNATIRKCIRKSKGALLTVKLDVDQSPVVLSEALMECLHDEPAALSFFNKLPHSHQKYYSNWIESAKTEATKAKRIAQAVTACARGQHYGEMMRFLKSERNDLLGI